MAINLDFFQSSRCSSPNVKHFWGNIKGQNILAKAESCKERTQTASCEFMFDWSLGHEFTARHTEKTIYFFISRRIDHHFSMFRRQLTQTLYKTFPYVLHCKSVVIHSNKNRAMENVALECEQLLIKR